MAGMHFIILKINGVDVSEMPHEEAVQMFLKASEPIVVEVRRRSYNSNSDEIIECLDKTQRSDIQINQKDNQTSRRQSPTIHNTSQLMSPVKNVLKPIGDHQTSSSSIPHAVDSLKFHSLIISSSQNSIGLDSCNTKRNHRACETYLNSCAGGSLPAVATAKTHEYSASQSQTTAAAAAAAAAAMQQPKSATASAATSPTKSQHQQSASSSPFKEIKLLPPPGDDDDSDDDRLANKTGQVSIGIQTDSYTADFIFSGSTMLNSEQIIENDHNLFSECIAPEIDIEEITLRKSDSNERLGLTVCYSSGGGNGSGSDDTDTCTEVYISDIVPDSIAGRDGRLRQGDQILQVNGKDVSNKEETETLIAENNNAVTLLVSRYLYGEDDEFNETGDFYDDDEPNMAYANCFLGNYIFTEDLPKSGKSSQNNSPEKKAAAAAAIEESKSVEIVEPPAVRSVPDVVALAAPPPTATISSTSSQSRDPLHHQNIRAHLEQVNQEIAILDSRVENMMSQHAKPLKIVEVQQPKDTSVAAALPSGTQVMDYDTEHIYETIPEDSESEPFYCSPYESSEHQTRVEQWLGMQDTAEMNETRVRSLQSKPQIVQHTNDSLSIWTKTKNGTVRSTNSSAGDDHENSSSAYNTGGSCNSNTMTPLTLELNSTSRDREHYNTSTLVLCPAKHIQNAALDAQPNHSRLPMQSETIMTADNQKSSSAHRYAKEKNLSPTHSWKVSQNPAGKHKLLTVPQKSDVSKSNPQAAAPISATNTMYTNVANLQQTMLLQQQLFRQALIHQRVPSNSVPCPQFTAPNLSQYHFVSSQEVSTVKLNSHPNEEHMVWKVKRRQDGTRYIVRRPARSRFLRNRALRISAERNDQTTEDDTISEIKTGRYWTKEERKKHIERARERRQRQQIIITNKNNELLPPNNGCTALQQIKPPELAQKSSMNDKLTADLLLLPQAKQSNAIQTPKVYRQSTAPNASGPTGFAKKLTKTKQQQQQQQQQPNVTGSPVEVNSLSIVANASAAASSGGKMFQNILDTSRVIQPRL